MARLYVADIHSVRMVSHQVYGDNLVSDNRIPIEITKIGSVDVSGCPADETSSCRCFL
jgi:hypothetical protein